MTHTRVHTFVTFANPHLVCGECRQPAPRWHDARKCGCTGDAWIDPCGHRAEAGSVCPSWSPVDGCTCLEVLGSVEHPPRPGRRRVSAPQPQPGSDTPSVRWFRLHLADGRVWNGAHFPPSDRCPDGFVCVHHPDEPNVCTIAVSIGGLLGNLRPGDPLHGARVEWPAGSAGATPDQEPT